MNIVKTESEIMINISVRIVVFKDILVLFKIIVRFGFVVGE